MTTELFVDKKLVELEFFCKGIGLHCQKYVSIKPYTSLKIGGIAPFLIEPLSIEQAQSLFVFMDENHIPWKILGAGSNVLIPDEELPYGIIRLNQLNRIDILDNGIISVEAGVNAPALAQVAGRMGLSGLEFIAGIPGQVGGLIRMNAGAFGYEIYQVLHRVWIWQRNEKAIIQTEVNPELFSYRKSPFQGSCVVLRAEFVCQKKPSKDIFDTMKIFQYERRKKQPIENLSAGCAFKNPRGYSAGELIDKAGLKGFRIGDMMVSDKHANFLVNLGRGRFQDALDVIRHVQKTVHKKFDIILEPEIVIWERSGEYNNALQ